MGAGRGKGAGLDSKTLGMILAGIGLVCVIFLLIAIPTKSWISTDVATITIKCGIASKDCTENVTLTGSDEDTRKETLGLEITALLLIFFDLLLAVLVVVGSAPGAAGMIGAILAVVALILETAGWAHFRKEGGDSSGIKYGYGFALAVVVMVLLLIWVVFWLMLHMSGGGGDSEEAQNTTSKAEASDEPGVPVSPQGMGSEHVKITITDDGEAGNVESLDYFDYNVDDEGNPVAVHDKSQMGQFRCAGDSMMSFGFQLTANEKAANPEAQQGHFMCLVDFEATGSEVHLRFEYNMYGDNKAAGAGLCAYLLDPSVAGWDSKFDGSGPMGFIGKTGAIVGVALDNNGAFTGDSKADHLTIKGAEPGAEILKSLPIEGGFMTGDEEWKQVHIKFDIKAMNCDVKLDGNLIMDDINFGDIKIPSKLCVAVCGAASDPKFMIAVNDVKLEDVDEEGHEDKHQIHAEEAAVGIPKGCTDYKVEDGALVESSQEETWRCAGHTLVEYGFELTQDEDDQEGHLLCRQPFEVIGSEIHASLEYVMEPKSFEEEGGQGLCIYLVDPAVVGWDRHFDGSGPLGFVGKKGAILGVGIDCTGVFCQGQPASVAVKRASDNVLLCDPVQIAKTEDGQGVDGVKTEEDEWRRVKVKFDIEDMTVDVKIGGHKYLDNVKIDLGSDPDGNPVKIPRSVCIGVCAGTADGKNNHICVNDVRLESEESDD